MIKKKKRSGRRGCGNERGIVGKSGLVIVALCAGQTATGFRSSAEKTVTGISPIATGQKVTTVLG